MTNNGDSVWDSFKKLHWWVLLLTLASLLAGAALGLGKWVYTRASTDEVAAVSAKIVSVEAIKEDKTNATTERAKLDAKIDEQSQVLGNVRDNLIVIMERQRLQPVPLPDPLPQTSGRHE